MSQHPISIEMLEEGHTLLLGQTRSGKTYQQRGFLERLRGADRRVGAVDKLGNHWGLTLSADGKAAGLDFIIFGGKHAHLPMAFTDGEKLGRLFVTRNIPAIFDVSQWKSDEQQIWMADFADAVFLHNQGALHLGLDEAQSWVPQGGGGDAFKSVLRLAEQGLGNGIRLMMAAQRLSRIDKSAAGMAAVVITMRQIGTADRKAMRDLLAANDEDIRRLDTELAGLPTGTGFVWDPLQATLARHAFPRNATFDSSRTPKHGDTPPAPIAVSSALVDELRHLLAPAKGRKPESQKSGYPDDSIPADPLEAFEKSGAVGTMLQERDDRIAELEAEVEKWRSQFRFRGQVLERTQAERDHFQRRVELVRQALDAPILDKTKSQAKAGAEVVATEDQVAVESVSRAAPETSGAVGSPPPSGKGKPPAGETQLNKTAIAAAELLKAMAPDGFTWNDVLLVLGRRPNSGDSRAARKALLERGLIVDGAGVTASEQLCSDASFGHGLWPSGGELVELWADKLRGPGGAILRSIADGGPGSRQAIADRIGKSATSGWWRQGIKDLLHSNVVRDVAGELQLHPFLETDQQGET